MLIIDYLFYQQMFSNDSNIAFYGKTGHLIIVKLRYKR